MSRHITMTALSGIPAIAAGDDLVSVVAEALYFSQQEIGEGDVIVIAQKIVSKAEGRFAELSTVMPSTEARKLAQETQKDARFVQLVMNESSKIVRSAPNVLISTHKSGHTAANAGIDQSNVEQSANHDRVLLLPEDSDASAKAFRQGLKERFGYDVAIIICDSFGRPWRVGTVGFAIGCAGFAAVEDQCGDKDMNGRALEATFIARADELAAAASILMGQGAEATPVVLIKGAPIKKSEMTSRDLLRVDSEDLFR
jgi:coenzyme F420-0:L-glutamate ligase / coenzyme F420-1:gamma-L-glutamate ligase